MQLDFNLNAMFWMFLLFKAYHQYFKFCTALDAYLLIILRLAQTFCGHFPLSSFQDLGLLGNCA